MMFYPYPLVRALLFKLDPEKAHHLTLKSLKLFWKELFYRHYLASLPQQSLELWGLHFANPIGLPGGFDSNADYFESLFGLGVGFVEVGAVTPFAQSGNPKPRLFRLPEANALINRMGFPNKGVDYLVERLKQRRVNGVVGVNIGKNRDTSLENALQDYQVCLEKVYPYADYVTINISSPNTPGLRQLQSPKFLSTLLTGLDSRRKELQIRYHKPLPLLVKTSVDIEESDLEALLEVSLTNNIQGIVTSNTSVDHSSVATLPHASEQGGLSGAPLRERTTAMIAKIYQLTQGKLPIIGLGGIMSLDDAKAHFDAGASLVQLYTGLIYKGPKLIRDLLHFSLKKIS